MKPLRYVLACVCFAATGAAAVLACGGDDDKPAAATTTDAGPRGFEQAGQACTAASQCYGGVDGGADAGGLKGEVQCLTRVTNGYCTHLCTQDSDCCAVPGECKTGIKQVCAPFESTGQKMCFLSCEEEDIKAGISAQDAGAYFASPDAGAEDTLYCQTFASQYATCRSSGGGKENRKLCVPQQ